MKRILIFLLIFTLAFGKINAQRYFGLATGEYNTINSMYLNPANLAGCPEKFALSLFSFNLTFDNSLASLPSLGNTISQLSSNSSGKSIFTTNSNGRFSMLLPTFEMRGPGVLFAINDKHTIAISTRVRIFNQFDNFDKRLFNYLTEPNYVSNNTYSVNVNGFNWTAQIWSELGLSYGGVLFNSDALTVKAGGTIRYLMGTGFIGLKSNNFDVTYYGNTDSLYAQNTDLEYASSAFSADKTFIGGAAGSGILNNFLGAPIGSGVGGDLGFIFIIRPGESDKGTDEAGNHQIKLSASVTDIGAINYKSGNNYGAYFSGNGGMSANGFSGNVKSFQSFKNYAVGQGFYADTSTAARKVYLPTALLLGADYNIYSRFYANLTMVANLANRDHLGNSYYGQVSLTPRFDTKVFTFGMPITYNMLTDNIRLGMGLRFSGFMIGSDDIMMLVANHQYGINLYMGAYIPIGTSKKSDGGAFRLKL